MPQQEEQLLEHVKVLATADGRAMGTAGHSRARKYICAILKHLQLKPYIDESFEIIQRTATEELINVVAVAPGRHPDRKPILVGAHYDTFGSLPGADDNAAAVSIVLEIGRSLAYLPAYCDLVLALFDNEEFGYLARASMGSTRFYEDVCERPVRCAFIMDLVGHDAAVPNLEQLMFVKGMESSPTWAALLRNTEPSEGLS
ncbi:MAG: M28 family peptidase [Candidatus Obscuribacterales bacterium]|nr:M28 family peptidase [Candidatus Obscuribacterales bacterium]